MADDQAQVRELVKVTLAGNYTITTVSSGAEAIAAFTNSAYDLLILDVMMPGEFDGLATARHIRETDSEVPIIFLSAKGQEDDMAAGKAAGGNHYLVKPFSPLELLDKVETSLNKGS